MKTKRRHELHTNVLADWLGKHLGWLRPMGRWVAIGVAAAVLAIVMISFRNGHSESQMAEAWDRLSKAMSEAVSAAQSSDAQNNDELVLQPKIESIEKLAGEYRGTPLAVFANSGLADLYLIRGETLMKTDRAAAMENFKRAARLYSTAAQQADAPMVKERALFNLGESYEWMFQLDDAQRTYQQVKDLNGLYAANAQERIDDLDQPSSKKFYQTLHKFEPKPPAVSSAHSENPLANPLDDFFKQSGGNGKNEKSPTTKKLPAEAPAAGKSGKAENPPSGDKAGGSPKAGDQSAPGKAGKPTADTTGPDKSAK